ncbi:MAG: Lrp/AsnC family transcriptional regulator [Desulfobulbaceae bacterium]|nr:Lrp/AsnC family transcriptional regulator [Desulfobulbaceae bacterium]
MITEKDRKIISLIQGDIPLDARPFAIMAEQAGMEEEDFINGIKDLRKRGILRRFGATLRHQEAGFRSNAMVAWIVPEERVQQTGTILSKFREVTHCYNRIPRQGWPYNLYAMIHGGSRKECRRIAEKMSRDSGISDYSLLFSEKEFKKTSMEYF